MVKGLIRLCYSKIIDASSAGVWDKYVFEDTYKEFFMQSQYFNQQQKFLTFREILENDPKADELHYLVSTAAIGYLRQLNERIPVKNFRFEILQSHVKDQSQHRVAIHFYSEVMTWIDTIGNQLLLATGDQLEAMHTGQFIDTDMLALRPYLSISSFQLKNVQLVEVPVQQSINA
jgi:hypothetical protein